LGHELGHSFFGLTDEYELESTATGISGTDAVANLDDKHCSKWADLTRNDWGVTCEGGHGKGKAYFASGKTFMNDVKDPFGVANERISCCKYEKLNDGALPVYCQKFDQNGLDLTTFCKSSAVRLWWDESLFQDGELKANATLEQKLRRQANDLQGHHYAFVEAPTRWSLLKVGGVWGCVKGNDLRNRGIYLKDEVLGYAASEETLAAEGRADKSLNEAHRTELIVTVLDATGRSTRALKLLPESLAEAPPKAHDPIHYAHEVEVTDINFILNQGESCVLEVDQAGAPAKL
jgi:hypothetical protein